MLWQGCYKCCCNSIALHLHYRLYVNTDAMPWLDKTKHFYILRLREQVENFLFMGYYCIETKTLTLFH